MLPVRIDRRALRGVDGETGIRVRRLASAVRRPFLAFPVNRLGGRGHAGIFPPHIAVGRERDVGEDGVLGDGGNGVRVGLDRGSRRDAEETAFRVHRPEPAVLADANPGDVVAEAGNFPAGQGGQHHREVRLAAGAGERGGDIVFLARRRGEAEDEHVLGQPAFALGDGRGDAQREAFFAEQRVAAVTGTVGPDGRIVGEMDDVFFLRIRFARPGDVLLTGRERRADGVDARNERAFVAELVEHRLAHAGHDAHVDDDVGGVGDFDADFADGRIERAHRKRNDIHRAALHAALEQGEQFFLHRRRVGPVVCRAGFFLGFGADERAVLDARHVAGVRAGEVAAGALLGVQLGERAMRHQQITKRLVFFFRSVAPVDVVRLAQFGHLPHPGNKVLVGGIWLV